MIHILSDGTGDFPSIQKALDYLAENKSKGDVLLIHKGIYKERITVTVPHVTFLGEGPYETVLTGGLGAKEILSDGKKRGTFRTYSCLIDADDFSAENLTFENTAGPGPKAGQALAMYADGDRLRFVNCRFLGNQDTLFTAPLPPKEIEPDGFIGPKQNTPRRMGRHYYKDCYLEGDIDFVFGGATAYFEGCTFYSKDIGKEINSFVTAASTPEGQPYGYVMKECRFEGGCPARSAYLGRPWREYAKTVLLDCYIGEHIREEGWNDWNKEQAHQTVFYGEYGSYGPGAAIDKRPDWVHRLTKEDLSHYTKEAVLSGGDGWCPVP